MKKYLLVVALIAMLAIIAACAPAPTAVPPTPVPPTAAVPPTQPPTAVPTQPPAPTAAPVSSSSAASSVSSSSAAVSSSSAASSSAASSSAAPAATILTINLKKGVKWSDGSDLTSKDVVGTWDIMWMQSSSSWASLNDVTAPDANTVVFNVKTSGPAILDTIIRSTITRPYSQYGKWMDAAAGFRKNNTDRKSTDVTKTLDDLNNFRPANAVVYGPYNVDPKSLTEAQLTLVKNPTGFNADKIDFDKVIVYQGDTTQDMPLYLSGDMDYSSNAYSPANLQAIKAQGNQYVVLGGPGTNGPGMYFNNDVYPLNRKEVRQAFAYAINRVENAQVAFGDAGKPIKYEAGFTDAAVPTWLSADQIAKLNTYDYNPAKAEALLSASQRARASGVSMTGEIGVPSEVDSYIW